ncbi:acyl-CoA dehydrogenase family protein [Pseudonocardia sp. TRM90224]|uniref:acyl-CoA dehydrogenase family protein n=1 Tax=Pseudonocardia sp. TRM90224 TaxID=2812678 RepID=UPI001E35178C|nr:acyl-CoA dehydrogenase family protein [Pseudonocardia sp. TRM90224]
MMRFGFSAEQQIFAKRSAEFAAKHVAPFRRDHDQRGRYRDGLIAEMGAHGFFGLRVPVEHGGLGLDATSTGIALEELAAADLSVCFPVLNAALTADVLIGSATPEQLRRWLPAIASGGALVAVCLTEPGHGTDAANIVMRATPDGDGWVLNGTKASIMSTAYATHGLVFARTGEQGAHGVTAFYVPLDEAHVTRERCDDLGCRAGGRGNLVFDGLRVGPEDVVGGPGAGFVQVMRGFAFSRALIALMAIAVGRVSLDEAAEHAARREAFGRPLSTFQAVAFPLVEHITQLHAARLVSFEALSMADAGLDPRVSSNMAKWWAPKAAMEAVHQSLLTLGHVGWSEDGPVAQRLRDVIGLQLADGTAAATKLVLARNLFGKQLAP